MTIFIKPLAAALLALLPVTAVAAAEPGTGSAGMLGNHPAVIAHLLAMPAVADSAPMPVELAVHPAVTAYLLMRGGVVNQSAAPQVKTAFNHINRTRAVQTAALTGN